MADPPAVEWEEGGVQRCATWRSERGEPPPARIAVATDETKADEAYGLATQGVALLYRGDFQNARQLLGAMARRADRKPRRKKGNAPPTTEAFNLERQFRAQRARTLGRLLFPLEADYGIALRRAPDIREACHEAYGPPGKDAG